MCNWEQISLPKSFGGWGIHNIFDFSNSLAVNTLWRVLMGEGIWHRVVIKKYLHWATVINWLRSQYFKQTGMSRIWSGLLKVIYLILHGLSWIPRTGQLITLGKDQILGMGDSSFLSCNLLTVLKEKKHLYACTGHELFRKINHCLPIGLATVIWDWRAIMHWSGIISKEHYRILELLSKIRGTF
jgi:hypothetical protein